MRTINRIFIHTAAAAAHGKPVDQSAATIRAYHVREKGWSDIGYHWVVRMGGDVERGRPEGTMGAQVEGANHDSIGIVLSGHGDIEAPPSAQWEAAVRLVVERLWALDLADDFIKNPMRVVGHRELNALVDAKVYPLAPKTAKTCPGTQFDMRAFRIAVMRELGH